MSGNGTSPQDRKADMDVVCRHGRHDLVDTVVAPASAEAAATAVADIREERERVSKYLIRLKEVRHKRSAMEVCCAVHCTALLCTELDESSRRTSPLATSCAYLGYCLR